MPADLSALRIAFTASSETDLRVRSKSTTVESSNPAASASCACVILINERATLHCAGVIASTNFAKAPAELSNPEKSLTATLPPLAPGEGNRSFRYAPLSSGLEIVRKCLGRHEIAALQTTAIDREAGFIRLTTVLAHSSGEWVSSDWPVCPVAETAAPHRMGAALTYARRYALFTLVGIAGEDDLDAPDLTAQGAESGPSRGSFPSSGVEAGSSSAAETGRSQMKRSASVAAKPTFDSEQSAKLRDALIAELKRIGSPDDAAVWARRNLAAKNTLTAADANAVEHAFAERLSTIDQAEPGPTAPERGPPSPGAGTELGRELAMSDHRSRPVLQKEIRFRDKEHRKFVARQPCLVCGRAPSDPHHLRFAQPRALGRRVSDEFTVPLCRAHHRELHRRGDEAAWWQVIKIDPMPLALRLWQQTRRARIAL